MNHDGLIDYNEFLPMMLKIIWADQRGGGPIAAPERIPHQPHEAYYSLLARREAATPGESQGALDQLVAAKEHDIIASFLREDA